MVPVENCLPPISQLCIFTKTNDSTSELILPLASLALAVWTWWLASRHGWTKALPVFSWYVGFYCVTTGALLLLSHWSWYPQRIQGALCKLYSWSYSSVSVITTLFLFAVLYELFSHAAAGHSRIQRRAFGVPTLIAIFLVLLGGVAAAVTYKGTSGCCVFEQFSGVVSRGGILMLIALLFLLLIIKRVLAVRFGRTVSLIVTSLAILCVGDVTWLIVEYNYSYSLAFSISEQLIGFVSIVLWFIAVRHSPQEPLQKSA